MTWLYWGAGILAALFVLGYILEKFEKSTDEPSDELPMQDGLPDVSETIRLAKAAFESGHDAEAFDLLHDCRNVCGELEMTSSVQTLSNEIIGLRNQRQADACAELVLHEISSHPEGILQTELYKLLPDVETEIARFACYRLAEAGKITRQKKGRSYLLRLE